MAAAHNGSQFMKAQRNQGMRAQRSEVTLELTYLAQFGSHLAVQPDFQFVMIQTQTRGSRTRLRSFFGSNFHSDPLRLRPWEEAACGRRVSCSVGEKA
jgi:hypothetical protein